jgi:hypothetical protein
MSDATPSQLDAESRLLDGLDEMMKSAVTQEDTGFVDVEPARFEARVEVTKEDDEPEPEPEPESQHETSSRGTWLNRPSVRNQAINHPDTVRMVNPVTRLIDPQDENQLAEFNRIQMESSKEAPTLAITTLDRQFFEGKWFIFMTYSTVEYLKL